MRALDRKWQRHSHFLPAARSGFQFLMAPDSGHKPRFAQHDFQRATLVTTEQKSRERVLQIALGVFARVTLRMNIEQITRGDEPFALFPNLRGEFEFH